MGTVCFLVSVLTQPIFEHGLHAMLKLFGLGLVSDSAEVVLTCAMPPPLLLREGIIHTTTRGHLSGKHNVNIGHFNYLNQRHMLLFSSPQDNIFAPLAIRI